MLTAFIRKDDRPAFVGVAARGVLQPRWQRTWLLLLLEKFQERHPALASAPAALRK